MSWQGNTRNRPFDIVILGSSLTARMTAALLAKQGQQVFLFQSPESPSHWWHSSLFLEKLLGTLGGRACYAPCQPFQVISAHARVTIHPEIPLDRELSREFGTVSGGDVLGHLHSLQQLGEQLELLLWEFGGLPERSFGEQLRWRWQAQRRKVPVGSLTAPLAARLAVADAAARDWLTDLFQGLALQPLAQLRVADGALLWAQARRPEGIHAVELLQLLDKRCEQFHVVTAPLSELSAITQEGRQWQGTLHGGGRFVAAQLLLGDRRGTLPAMTGLPLPGKNLDAPGGLFTSPLNGNLSPLLENHVIAGGPRPLRLVVTQTPEGQIGQLEGTGTTDLDILREQLEPILPFARYQLTPAYAPDPAPPAKRPLSLGNVPIRTGHHVWCGDAMWLLPQFGNAGAALLSWTLLQKLTQGRGLQD